MKSITKLMMLALFVFSIICFVTTDASAAGIVGTTYKNDNGNASWTLTSQETEDINGLTHIEMYGTTSSSLNANGKQHVNYLEMKTDGVNTKLVTWAKMNGSKSITLSSLTSIAKDYEATHPGWIVLGGVNGDQYVFNVGNGLGVDGSHYYNYQPYYPMKIDGEARFPYTVMGVTASNYYGITNDGSTNGFIDPEYPAGVRIELLDEDGNITYTHKVDNINKSAGNGEVSVWSSYISMANSSVYVDLDVTTSKQLLIVEEPELAYMYDSVEYDINNTGLNGFFGRGTVSKVAQSYHFGGSMNNPDTYNSLNAFAIETDDADLIAKLAVGARIRVEYYWDNEDLNECESFLNYHFPERQNNKDVAGEGSYDTRQYNRSIWGRKADGTYILMTIAKGHYEGYSGASQDETNAILKSMGVVDAFQQDGGGSSMCIVRNAYGGFDLAQPSSDGTGTGQRSVGLGCFFVCRDTGISLKTTDYHTATFKRSETLDYTNAKITITINGKDYEMTGDTLTVDGLYPNTEYTYSATVVFDGDDTVTTTGAIKTQEFTFPNNMLVCTSVGKDNAIFNITDSNITKVSLYINDQVFSKQDSNVVVTELNPEQEYTYYYELTYHDPIANIDVAYTSLEDKLTTKAYNIPAVTSISITEIKDDSIEVALVVNDSDKLTTKVEALLNGAVYEEVSVKKSGNYSYEFEGISPNTESYELSFRITYKYEYEDGHSDESTITSDVVKNEITTPEPTPTPEPKKDCNSSAFIIVLASIAAASALGLVFKKH